MTVERNGNVRCVTDLPKELNNQVEAAMKSEGYNSKSNFIRSAVEEKLKKNINDGSDTTFVSKHVVANQYRLLNEKLDQKIVELENIIDEKNKQVELLTGVIGSALLLKNGRTINKDELNKFSARFSEIINSKEVTTKSITEIINDMLKNKLEAYSSLKSSEEKKSENEQTEKGTIVGVYDIGNGTGLSSDNDDLDNKENSEDNIQKNDKKEISKNSETKIHYRVSVSDFDPDKIKVKALKEPAKKLVSTSNSKLRDEYIKEMVFSETIYQNPMADKIFMIDPSINKNDSNEIRWLNFAIQNDLLYSIGEKTDDNVLETYKPVKDLHSKIIPLLNKWSDKEGHFDNTKLSIEEN